MPCSLEWIGHSCFLIKTPECTVIIDPFLDSNPKTRKTVDTIGHVDLILLSHGHFDHASEAIPLSLKTAAPIVSIPELCSLLKQVDPSVKISPMGIGGVLDTKKEFRWEILSSIKMVSALHSSSFQWNGMKHYAGLAAGFLITLTLGSRKIRLYHAGDTSLNMDMKLLEGLVDIAIVPIDGHYNMSWEDAKIFHQWISPKILIPMHYNTFPEIELDSSIMEELRSFPKVTLLDDTNYSLELAP